MKILDSHLIWICSDCLFLLANGDAPEDDGECSACKGDGYDPEVPCDPDQDDCEDNDHESHRCETCDGTGNVPTLAERIDANWQVADWTREREPLAERWDLALGGACTCDRYADPRRCGHVDADGDTCGERDVTSKDANGDLYCEDHAPEGAVDAPYVCHEHDPHGESDCETEEFSRDSCDGCGSHLGGSRHKATAFLMGKE